MSACTSCDCALVSMGAKSIAKLFHENADDLIKPLVGVGRDSQIRDTQALVEAAKNLYTEAQKFTKGKVAPIKHGQFLGGGVAGTLDWTLPRFDEIAADAFFVLEHHKEKPDIPLEKFSKIVEQLGDGFDDLGNRLAIGCSINQNLL